MLRLPLGAPGRAWGVPAGPWGPTGGPYSQRKNVTWYVPCSTTMMVVILSITGNEKVLKGLHGRLIS